MLTESERGRLDSLEQAQFRRSLSIEERADLARLAELVTSPDDNALLAATERMQHERVALDSDCDELDRLLARSDRRARRLQRYLALYRAERAAIDSRIASIGRRDHAAPRFHG